MNQFHHVSVLLEESVQALAVRPEGTYIDGTLGGAGHAGQVARRLTTGGSSASTGMKPPWLRRRSGCRRICPGSLWCMGISRTWAGFLGELGIARADGILLDLGVSSPSWTSRTGAFPTWPTRPWTCAWTAAPG